MALFSCKLGASDDRIIIRDFEAADSSVLRKNLEDQGFFVFEVKKKPFQFLLDKGLKRKRVDNKALLTFNQELLVLIKAGMPIMQVLDAIMERHDSGVLYEVLLQVRDDIKAGAALSVAMEKHGNAFPYLYIASIRAGERTGDLPQTIRRYIEYLKRVGTLRKKIIAAVFYPAILVVFALIAITLLLTYVVPTFSQVYTDSGSQLPALTQLLITCTRLLRKFFVFGAIAGIGLLFVFRSWKSTEAGRYAFDRFKLTVPIAGDVFSKYSVAGFTRTLATVLGSGIPIIESLRMSIGTLNNVFMEKRLFEAVRFIEEGGRLSVALERIHIMPPLALRMLGVGETTGALEDMLLDVSTYLEEELEERMHLLTTAIEPAIMLIMGIVIGVIIIAMYLPIFKIAGTVG
ncbi:MAG: type II secretion system F family protein [Desulfuromonadaceae bacterium]|nr:type II secretion system F family protein [Desulfuromonadaceae bacterium]MDD5107675.1 type II secretion system F family protein [Desulfuromonadaceae bacterium]